MSNVLNCEPSKRYPTKVTDQSLFASATTKRRIYKSIKKSPLNEEKGYKYSGSGVLYLFPEIVADLVDQDFETYLKNTVYRPLGAHLR